MLRNPVDHTARRSLRRMTGQILILYSRNRVDAAYDHTGSVIRERAHRLGKGTFAALSRRVERSSTYCKSWLVFSKY